MAVGKNKRLSKGKKGTKKKIVDFTVRKEWYSIKPPSIFSIPEVGKTLVNKTTGQKLAEDQLKGRVVEVSLADLTENPDDSFKNISLFVKDVHGKSCNTTFHGMNFTSDKLRSLVKKNHTLIEAVTDVRTVDGYVLRVFAIAFTFRQRNQLCKKTYTTTSKVKVIRKKMIGVIQEFGASRTLQEFVLRLTSEVVGKRIEKVCAGVYSFLNAHIRKVKVLKTPKDVSTSTRKATVEADDAGKPVATAKESNADDTW